MKFMDKDGNVFEDINSAIAHYCKHERHTKCFAEKRWCPLYAAGCVVLLEDNPAEAARLMGYEIVEDTAPESLPQGCHLDPPGMKGPPCGCPVCGGLDCIEWDGETDVSRCTNCGWSNGAFASKIKYVGMQIAMREVLEYFAKFDLEG